MTRASGKAAHPETGIAIRLTAPASSAAVAKAFSVEPPVEGTLTASAEPGEDGAARYTWTPNAPLEAGASYVFRLAASLADSDGVAISAPIVLEVTVAARPRVVRSQPADADKKIDRDQTISVRFSSPMDRRVTRAALRVSGLDPLKEAKVSWLESGRVLVLNPTKDFAYGEKVTIAILGAARSAAGVTLGDDPEATVYEATFTVEPKPAPKPKPKPVQRASGAKVTKTPTSGSGTSSAPWLAVEKYYLKLLNCTRTGGWVLADGSCKGYGSGTYSAYVKPLTLSSGISSKVARPYAKKLAVGNDCSHFIGGDPGDRLRRAGYTSYRWAENIGCRSGNPYDAVLASHRFFQSEKGTDGGHWRNIKDSRFSTVGIGVWKSGWRGPPGHRLLPSLSRRPSEPAPDDPRRGRAHDRRAAPARRSRDDALAGRRGAGLHEHAQHERQAPCLHRRHRLDVRHPLRTDPFPRDPGRGTRRPGARPVRGVRARRGRGARARARRGPPAPRPRGLTRSSGSVRLGPARPSMTDAAARESDTVAPVQRRAIERGWPAKRPVLHSRPMTKNLVIVESPAKARTIERYLGEDYRVLASYGHVRDLPENPGKGKLGVDVDHDFAPQYEVPESSRRHVADITRAAQLGRDGLPGHRPRSRG